MALTKYKQKRNFKESPEPQGGKPDFPQLRFVIQKHAASHLHYDFRLEMEGVLKSWAVPKGPSIYPDIKRLAMMVEDHPYDYRTFEGIIPSGYGAGTVIVWDEGTYEAAEFESKDKNVQDKELRRQLHSGKIKFILHGKKLRGEFALVKANGRGENGWLLFKIEDKYSGIKDITTNDKSVISKKTLEQVAATTDDFRDNKPDKKNKEKVTKEMPAKVNETTSVKKEKTSSIKLGKEAQKLLKAANESPFPEKQLPMLATLVDKPFDKAGWVYEVKWDGYRALSFINHGNVEIKSRNDKSFNEKFYPVYDALKRWGINAVTDGEIVVVNEKGMADFGALQSWRSEADGDLLYYVFDLLWYEGKDLTAMPLSERKIVLADLIPGDGVIRMSTVFNESGTDFFNAAKEMGLEGIIAKKADSHYYPGERSKEWLKIKANKRQEVVIGGYTQNEDSSKPFSSLLVGVYENGKLNYTGKIGTGFNRATQLEMMDQFKKLLIRESPFTNVPDINKPSRFRPNPPKAVATWLKPQLVCEVSFAEMTSDGVMRHPSFEGMRIDKKATEINLETEAPLNEIIGRNKKIPTKKLVNPEAKKERKTLLNPKDETQVRNINGHELKFTNLSKIFWPEDKITKRDMLNYYYQIAPFIIPYLKDRPQSLNRHPHGIYGISFYQKDVTGKAPDWIETFLYHSEADERDKHFMVCTDEASLLYMASLGCIEMNPWSSRVQSPDNPDWCIIDLDPADKTTFEQVIQAAQVTRKILDAFKIPSYPKTSGSTGIHIYIPLGAKYSYEQSKEFARALMKLVHKEIPDFTSMERATRNRGGKMYLDFLQNRPQATVAGPYSLRPKPGATVSMPLHWEEIKKGLKMKDFTIFNAIDRIRAEGDIFKPVLGKGINLEEMMKKLIS